MTAFNTFGTFVVTTEGDCEGRTTKHLGTYTGFIDEIAFGLADKQYYSLRFRETTKDELPVDRGAKRVNISMDAFGTGEARHKAAARMFSDRPVQVRECQNYGAITLTRNVSPEDEARIARELALAKLSPEDRQALGV